MPQENTGTTSPAGQPGVVIPVVVPTPAPPAPSPGGESGAANTGSPPAGGASPAQPAAAPPEDPNKGAGNGFQDRINELVRARGTAERETAYWRQVAEQSQAAAHPPAPAAPVEPRPEQFSDYGQYVSELAKWQAKQIAQQVVSEQLKQTAENRDAKSRETLFQQRAAELSKTIPEYASIVGASPVPISAHVGDAILGSERGPELALHFAQNPEIVYTLNGMRPQDAYREIGRLEATLPKPTPVATAKLTSTPDPANTGNGQGRSTTPEIGTMSMEEYVAHRRQQGARWAR